MKRIIGIFSILLLISCSPDAKLMAENEELKLMVEKQTELTLQSAAEATKAQAQAREAQAQAEENAEQAKLAIDAAAAEVFKQNQKAEEAIKKLKDCQ